MLIYNNIFLVTPILKFFLLLKRRRSTLIKVAMNCYIRFFVPQLCYCIIDLSYYDICKQDLDSVVSANESHSHTAHRSSFGRVNTSHKLGICCYKYVSKINFHRMLAPIAYNRLNPQIKLILRHYLLILDAIWSFEIMNPMIAIPTKPETNSTEAKVMIAPK